MLLAKKKKKVDSLKGQLEKRQLLQVMAVEVHDWGFQSDGKTALTEIGG